MVVSQTKRFGNTQKEYAKDTPVHSSKARTKINPIKFEKLEDNEGVMINKHELKDNKKCFYQ